jgi:hypothetical protein
MTTTGRKILEQDTEMADLISLALCSPRGYAYVRTACVAAFMGVGLAHAWNTHGNRLLASMEDAINSERKKLEGANHGR